MSGADGAEHWTWWLGKAVEREVYGERLETLEFRRQAAELRARRAEEALQGLRTPLGIPSMDGQMHLQVRLVDHTGKTAQTGKVISTQALRYAYPGAQGHMLDRTIRDASYEVIEWWARQQ